MEKKENKIYPILTNRYLALDKYTDDELDKKQSEFIRNVIRHYDMVEIGDVEIGNIYFDVESVFTDGEEEKIMLHLSSKELEGDIIYSSLQQDVQGKIVNLVYEEMKRIEEGPTIFSMMVGKNNILYRSVYVHELKTEVNVTTEEIYESFIKDGDANDNKFYCYVPSCIFDTLNDKNFEDYINKNF